MIASVLVLLIASWIRVRGLRAFKNLFHDHLRQLRGRSLLLLRPVRRMVAVEHGGEDGVVLLLVLFLYVSTDRPAVVLFGRIVAKVHVVVLFGCVMVKKLLVVSLVQVAGNCFDAHLVVAEVIVGSSEFGALPVLRIIIHCVISILSPCFAIDGADSVSSLPQPVLDLGHLVPSHSSEVRAFEALFIAAALLEAHGCSRPRNLWHLRGRRRNQLLILVRRQHRDVATMPRRGRQI